MRVWFVPLLVAGVLALPGALPAQEQPAALPPPVRIDRMREQHAHPGICVTRNDPHESMNLSGDPHHAKALAELQLLRQAGWRAALPPSR